MIIKIFFIFSLIILQNIFLKNPVYAAKKYIEVDSIVAVAGSTSITRLELKEKKGKIKESFIQKKEALPNDKEITKLALDQLITEKLVIEYASMQGINVSDEQLNNVVNNIAVSNNLTPKKLIEEQDAFEGTSSKPGSLMFEFTQQAKPKWAMTGQAFRPSTGDMVIFPALLQHWVLPFKSKCTRVSVSGNLEILNRQKLSNDFF